MTEWTEAIKSALVWVGLATVVALIADIVTGLVLQ